MNEYDLFEEKAERFYRAVGMLAPGKSESPAAVGQTEYDRHEVRRLLFDLWSKMERELSESKGREKVLSEMVKDSIGACCCDGKDHENDPCEYCDKAMKLLARLTPAPPEAKPCDECRGWGEIDPENQVCCPKCQKPAPGEKQ